jgi:hypothetical protein
MGWTYEFAEDHEGYVERRSVIVNPLMPERDHWVSHRENALDGTFTGVARAACSCGWHGPDMPEIRPAGVLPVDVMSEADEAPFREQWRGHALPYAEQAWADETTHRMDPKVALDALHIESENLQAEVAGLTKKLAQAEHDLEVEQELVRRLSLFCGHPAGLIHGTRQLIEIELNAAGRLADEVESFLKHPSLGGDQ